MKYENWKNNQWLAFDHDTIVVINPSHPRYMQVGQYEEFISQPHPHCAVKFGEFEPFEHIPEVDVRSFEEVMKWNGQEWVKAK